MCVQLRCESEKKEGGDLYPQRGLGSALQHLTQRGRRVLCMLGDKVQSGKIRSGRANETHTEGLHLEKIPFFILELTGYLLASLPYHSYFFIKY